MAQQTVSKMERVQTAVEWLENEIKHLIPNDIGSQLYYESKIEQAKQMEKGRELEIKQFWFGRGVLAGKEGRIEELMPKKD